MKFTSKIMLIPILTALTFIIIFAITWILSNMNQHLIERIESEHFQALELGHRLDKLAVQIRYTFQTALSIDDEEMIAEADLLRADYLELIRQGITIEDNLPNISINSISIHLISDEVLDSLEITFQKYYSLARPVTLEMMRNGFSDELFQNVARMNEVFDSLLAQLNQMTTKQKSDMKLIFGYARKFQSLLRNIIQYSILISFALIIAVSIVIIISIVRPLRKIIAVTEAIAQGDLDQKIDYKSSDEMGRLVDSFSKMQSSLITHIDDLKLANIDLSQANEDLKSAQIQLIQAEKMASLGRLVAGVAHEFNNPIGAIQSSSDTLKLGVSKLEKILVDADNNSESNTNYHKLLSTIKSVQSVISEGAHRVSAIVKRMKSFARLDEAEVQEANLIEIIESTIDFVQAELKSDVQIIPDLQDLPNMVCYPTKLNQLCRQLLSNANRSMIKGEIIIRAHAELDFIVLQVTDTGCGISAEHLKKVFDPGFTAWDIGIGVGLGLPLCFAIVKEHNGSIDISSEVGVGTTVTVRLGLDLG